ncbi:MAG: hypothetical protein JXQ71_07660 [Verrucomicrobia bacterium]|nr:hypothetical protein [Verrucomicrobiota bacterium]
MILVLSAALSPGQSASRGLPVPLAGNPGNIFLAGQDASVALPPGAGGGWQLLDAGEKILSEPAVQDGRVSLGRLPVGFYRLRARNDSNVWVSLGVLAPLKAPTPASSPVALDVAMAWFYGADRMGAVANLCALAGVNWVRDRLTWAHMEPRRGQWAPDTAYDASARIQAEAGLRVLQVHHASPEWANPRRQRFPLDLRDAYRFQREMARRWKGQVLAFEPWNEADIPNFGGHTGAEMAAHQKAAYLGLKAGNPEAVACLNVFAAHRAEHLADLQDNQAWPYFDTFNLHHYEAFERYPQLYAAFRAVSAGKPLWVTECARPVKWAGSDRLKEPADADLRLQAERVAKTFALSIHEGSAATFYFLLPHYVEGQTQFGILRPDLTPRPAFVALAAVGRLMAGARPLGKLNGPPAQQGCLFQVQADGHTRRLLVAWDDHAPSELALPAEPEAVFDHFGRERNASRTIRLTAAPRFVFLDAEAAARLPLSPPPRAPERLGGEPSPVVLQALWPADKLLLEKSACRIAPNGPAAVPLGVYNFSSQPVRGSLSIRAPRGWKVAPLKPLSLEPDARAEVSLAIDLTGASEPLEGTVRVEGDFGPAGRPVLSMRCVATR